MRKRPPFWTKVMRGEPHECWPWLGYRRSTGHGLTSHKSQMMNASRKAWILANGPITGDLCVNHRCDNAVCCNPDHMYLGTRADNMMDLWLKTPPDERMSGGRTCVLTDEQIEELGRMRKEGALLRECAAKFGVHLQTIRRIITNQRRAKLQKIYADRLSRV